MSGPATASLPPLRVVIDGTPDLGRLLETERGRYLLRRILAAPFPEQATKTTTTDSPAPTISEK